MVAYSFKGRFEPRIQARTKRQTIRAIGKKRHTRPGERITLTTGDRFHPRLIGEAVCKSVDLISLDLVAGRITLGDTQPNPAIYPVYRDRDDLDAFAVLDGFDDWADMVAFWRLTHPGADTFDGIRILWGGTFRSAS